MLLTCFERFLSTWLYAQHLAMHTLFKFYKSEDRNFYPFYINRGNEWEVNQNPGRREEMGTRKMPQ